MILPPRADGPTGSGARCPRGTAIVYRHTKDQREFRRLPAPVSLPWIYRSLARVTHLTYLQKMMLCLLGCTHLPLTLLLIAAAVGLVEGFAPDPGTFVLELAGLALSAALALWLTEGMLRPVLLTARALKAYARDGRITALPAAYNDTAGGLMRDASSLLRQLDDLRRGPENFDPASDLPNAAFLSRFINELAEAGIGFRVRMVRIAALDPGLRHADTSTLLRDLAEALERDDPARTVARMDDHTVAMVELTRDDAPPSPLRVVLEAFARAAPEAAPQILAGEALFPAQGGNAAALLAAATAALAPVCGPLAAPAVLRLGDTPDPADLERDLRRAVDDGGFRLFLQPVVATRTERIVSAEALLRWDRPLSGHVPPARFIPLLEQAGMIEEVGRWVLTAACRAIKVCDAAGLPQLQIAVNVSARELRNPGLLRQIRDVLTFEGVAPNRIELEMTESSAAEDLTRSRALFVGLRDMGVGVAIDDFGTGQGGLAYLKALPFSKLKIDREFVAGVDQRRDCQAICQSAIALAGGFDIDVVAEGVETAAEAARLRTFGCTQLQGFRFGRPMPAVDFPAFALHGI